MSSRARRISAATAPVGTFPLSSGTSQAVAADPIAAPSMSDTYALHEANLAALEREAFTKGFAQGELAGADAAAQRGEAMLHRLMQTLEELTALRSEMIRQTERQMVQLALAIAKRVVHREVSLDSDLLLAMARVALERLGESARVVVRLHPDDYAAAGAARVAELGASNVSVVADARLSRGACRVESDMGLLDAGVDAQLQELGRALLGGTDAVASASVGPHD
jgi:flagellar assembly protein FliH